MAELKVLMVEDDPVQQSLIGDAIDEFNDDRDALTISFDVVASSAEALEQLQQKSYDAVILDLLLEGDSEKSGVASGNSVLDFIVKDNTQRLIVYVVSGTLGSIDAKLDEYFENPLLRKFPREHETSKLLSDLEKVWRTGVTRILGGSGRLETLVNDIFFKHLARGFDQWVDQERDCEKELLRYTTLYLNEYLDLPETDGEENESKYFAPEFYVYPPIKSPMATGDIVEHEDNRFLLLSPSCDLAPRVAGDKTIYNVERVLLVRVVPLVKEVFDELGIQYASNGSRTNGKWTAFADGQRMKQQKQRFHYLPEYLELVESAVDFKSAKSIAVEEYVDIGRTKRIATITWPFVRDIQSRFSAYYGRQGQPSGHWAT